MRRYSYVIRLEGLNFDRLFKQFDIYSITIHNLNRINYKVYELSLSYNDYNKAKKFNLFSPYIVNIVKSYNVGFWIENFLKNIGLYIGVIVSILLCIIISSYTLKIDIIGANNIPKTEILSSLKEIGVSTNKINKTENNVIEQHLKKSFEDISLVSVIKKGTNLIVNVKEKELVEQNYSPICAPNNLLIERIDVSQGIQKVKEGDIVKKGDVLVEPSIMSSEGKTVYLKPIAQIVAKSWVVGVVEFDEEEKVYNKTGRKVVNSHYEIMGVKIFSKTTNVKFENYEKKVYNDYVFKNMFLPVKLNQIIYYETKESVVKKSFEDNKNYLIEQSKNEAYKKLPNGVTVEGCEIVISKSGKKYFVTTYLQINITIEG